MAGIPDANPPKISALKKGWLYFNRSLRLVCPVCGVSPIFCPLIQIRRPADWFNTLPGCPRCNYQYEQESGYFMLAIWSLDYGPAALVGISLLLIYHTYLQLSTPQLLLWTLAPTLVFALLIVRHAKAFYLAIDHYFFHS